MGTTTKSRKLHKSSVDRLPSVLSKVYSDDEVEVFQAIRTLKFWIRFKVADKYFVFWTEVFDFDLLSESKKLRKSYCDSVSAMVDTLNLPSYVLQ